MAKVRRDKTGPASLKTYCGHLYGWMGGRCKEISNTGDLGFRAVTAHRRTERRRRTRTRRRLVCWLVACLTSQQHANVSQGRICSDNFTCCHTEIEAADQTFFLTQSQYTDTGPTSPSADHITPGAWQGSHWSANL